MMVNPHLYYRIQFQRNYTVTCLILPQKSLAQCLHTCLRHSELFLNQEKKKKKYCAWESTGCFHGSKASWIFTRKMPHLIKSYESYTST